MSFKSDNSRHLKDWLKVFSQSPQIRGKLYQTRIEKMWEEVMGPVINSYTRRIRLDEQVLMIYVDSAPLKAELSNMKDTILQSVNQRLGENFIREVKIF